MTQKMTIHYT